MGEASTVSVSVLREFLSKPLGRVLRTLIELPGPRRFLVGGPVRDLLLGRPVVDLDLTVEGDPRNFLRRAAEALEGRLHEHPRFQTWRLDLPGDARVDFAALRDEDYPVPGGLPVVKGGDLAADLRRRDFTINAMALELGENLAGPLHDPYGGRADLLAGRLRVLHEGSFEDDPTRLWRTARFAARLAFELEPQSARWAHRAIARGALATVSGQRQAREIEKLFEDDGGLQPGEYLSAAQDLGLWHALDPRLAAALPPPEALDLAARHWRFLNPSSPTWTVPFGVMLDRLPASAAATIVERLALPNARARELLARPAADLEERLAAAGKAYGALLLAEVGDLPAAVRARLWARGGSLRRWVEIYQGAPKPTVTGAALISAGARPGHALGRALEQTHGALVEGSIGREEELAYALRVWRSLA